MTESTFAPNADELLQNNVEYSAGFEEHLPVAPQRRLAVVACMDSRMDVFEILGLKHGEAHVIRNAGGIVTDDVIRSLAISQRVLGTCEILLMHHTDCGMQKLTDDDFLAAVEADTGVKPHWSVESFRDPFDDTAQSIRRLKLSPFLPNREHIRGFVYDVQSGVLHEVQA